jgi:signal transduction histidine kinase
VPLLRRASEREPDAYVVTAINQILERLGGRPDDPEPQPDAFAAIDETQAHEDAYAAAVEDTTQMLVHELRRFVGLVRIAARSEIDAFPQSATAMELDRLSSLMDAVERLGRAAATPAFEEFDLAGLVLNLRALEGERFDVTIAHQGPDPLVVVGDPGLIELAARNGLVNACESAREMPTEEEKVVILTWGLTDRDVFIAVLDRGEGLPSELPDPFAFAQSNKSGHLGVGLALARRALQSLGGYVSLRNRAGGGATYEMRWPIQGKSVESPSH